MHPLALSLHVRSIASEHFESSGCSHISAVNEICSTAINNTDN